MKEWSADAFVTFWMNFFKLQYGEEYIILTLIADNCGYYSEKVLWCHSPRKVQNDVMK